MKTYFYQKPDGEIFACGQAEAVNIHGKFKQIGVSDGRTYNRMVSEHEDKLQELADKLEELRNQIEGCEFKQEAVELKSRFQSVMRKFDKERKFNVKEAFDKELEVARGNFETPTEYVSGSHGLLIRK